MTDVSIIRTGVANIASVARAFDRLGATVRIVDDAASVRDAKHVVLPGVGAFGAGMRALEAHGLVDAIRGRIEASRPTFAICLGLQLLCEASSESPGVEGVAAVTSQVERLRGAVRIPHLGWTLVSPAPSARIVSQGGYAYYAHSFCIETAPEGWIGAVSEHGQRYVAALERGPVVACQFHPELSSAFGRAILERWMRAS